MKKNISYRKPASLKSLIHYPSPPKLSRSVRFSKLTTLVINVQNGLIQVSPSERQLISNIPLSQNTVTFILENKLEEPLTKIYKRLF